MGRSRDRDEDRFDDDLPRRRRDRTDREEDDDLPRRRRDRSDPDDDDRPRRRRESVEEGDDRPRRRDRFDDDRPRRERLDDFDDDDRPRRRRGASRGPAGDSMAIWLWVGGGALVLLLIVGGVVGYMIYQSQWAPLRNNMAAYLAGPTGRPTVTPPAGAKRMVVVDVDKKDVDSLHTYLSTNERADKPELVTYVAQCRWQTNKVGSYSGGGGAYRYEVNVAVIDLSTGQQVANRHFQGSQPPTSFRGRRGESRYGSKPHDEVLSFLRTFAGR